MEQVGPLLVYTPVDPTIGASLRVEDTPAGGPPVTARLLGKFCEHLGANIYQGMEAQILTNPTMARWRFSAGDNHPDGGVREESERARIEPRIAAMATRHGWPDSAPVIESYFDGGAYGWFRLGTRAQVTLGPAVGAHGGRAQRVEVGGGGGGGHGGGGRGPADIGQWVYLPLHRVRQFEYRLVARALGSATVTLRLEQAAPPGAGAGAAAGAEVAGAAGKGAAASTATGGGAGGAQVTVALAEGWRTVSGRLELAADAPADALFRLSLTVDAPAHLVLDRVLLYPADHVGGADPEVIARLREAKLPLLRWPGGNFVSGYHWRDGVGPPDARPSRPNPAWEGVEFNLFGTDEFIAFCRAVGCEPLICVNAGDGTAAEAAAWVESCNGPTSTPMGRRRAANGHPRPYGVRSWEIGNEVYGRWQVGWTTAAGHADRYRRFRQQMLAADPSLYLIGCGYGNEPLSDWNQQLLDSAGGSLECVSDHILTGGRVDASTDPVELFHAFMGYSSVLEERYRALRGRMLAAGIGQPRLAITEMQLFAYFAGEPAAEPGLTPAKMPAPDTLAEALALALTLNTCIRLGDFVELVTHSATVNHGGGLRKARERVYSNPVHHAHGLMAALVGGVPAPVHLSCASFATRHAFGHIPPMAQVPYLDALAVQQPSGELVLMLVHRGGDCGPIDLEIAAPARASGGAVHLAQLAGPHWWASNSLATPDKVAPRHDRLRVGAGGRLALRLPPFSLTRLVFAQA